MISFKSRLHFASVLFTLSLLKKLLINENVFAVSCHFRVPDIFVAINALIGYLQLIKHVLGQISFS